MNCSLNVTLILAVQVQSDLTLSEVVDSAETAKSAQKKVGKSSVNPLFFVRHAQGLSFLDIRLLMKMLKPSKLNIVMMMVATVMMYLIY